MAMTIFVVVSTESNQAVLARDSIQHIMLSGALYMLSPIRLSVFLSDGWIIQQEAKLTLG